MFREELDYQEKLARIKTALNGVGIYNFHTFKAADSFGKINIDGLEELMLSTWSMMQLLIKFLKTIRHEYEGGLPISDLHVSIENMMKYIVPESAYSNMVTDEAHAMEKVSRSAYAWLKAMRMLKGQTRIPLEAYGWEID